MRWTGTRDLDTVRSRYWDSGGAGVFGGRVMRDLRSL